MQEPPVPPRQKVAATPPALEAVYLKALAKRPEARYASAKELADDVRRWLADEPVAAYREPFRVRAGRWVRRHRTTVAALVALVLASLVSLAGATMLLAAANQRERELRLDVTRQRDEALIQKERADRNLAEASDLLRTFYVTLSRASLTPDGLLNEQMPTGVWMSMLKSSDRLYEHFISQAVIPGLRAEQGRVKLLLGKVQARAGEAAPEAAFRQAEAIFSEAVDADPKEPTHRLGLAESLVWQATLLDDDPAAAEATYRKAISMLEGLQDEEPVEGPTRMGILAVAYPGPTRLGFLAMAYSGLTQLLSRHGRGVEALPVYGKTIALEHRLDGLTPMIRHRLDGYVYEALDKRGELLADLGRHAETIRDWDRLIEKHGGPGMFAAGAMVGRAFSLAHMGKAKQAAEELKPVVGMISKHDWIRAAAVFSLASASLPNQERLQADEYAEKAVRRCA